jgi:hypothetical protein
MEEKLDNKGVSKEGSKIDTTSISLPNDQIRIDCTDLATKDCEGRLSKKDHIDMGSARPSDR